MWHEIAQHISQAIGSHTATYYGDREVDIAMSELFAGFPSASTGLQCHLGTGCGVSGTERYL